MMQPSTVLTTSLYKLCESGDIPTDCVLICTGGEEVPSRVFLLSALSPVLLAAFRPGRFAEAESRRYDLSDFPASVVKSVIAFFLGQGELCEDDATSYLELADCLGIEDLKVRAESLLRSKLTTDNVEILHDYATRFGCTALANETKEIMENQSLPSVVSSLMLQRQTLDMKMKKMEENIRFSNERLNETKSEHRKLNERINYETNKAVRESHTKISAVAGDGLPPYPVKCRRRLVVRCRKGSKPARTDPSEADIPVLYFKSHLQAFDQCKRQGTA